MVVEPWMPLFPPRVVKTLRYSTDFTLTSTAGAVATYVFRANDLYDPDYTGSGHQPMGFDQMMQFYNHFCVLKARIVVTAKNYGSVDCTVAVRQDADLTPITTIDRILEFGGLVTAELEVAGGFGANKVLELTLDVPRLQGVSRSAVTADPNLRGDASSSPTEVSYFHVQIWDAGGNNQSVKCSVILEQMAVFTEPRDMVSSLGRLSVDEAKSKPDRCAVSRARQIPGRA